MYMGSQCRVACDEFEKLLKREAPEGLRNGKYGTGANGNDLPEGYQTGINCQAWYDPVCNDDYCEQLAFDNHCETSKLYMGPMCPASCLPEDPDRLDHPPLEEQSAPPTEKKIPPPPSEEEME
jgi:hypothetical protein